MSKLFEVNLRLDEGNLIVEKRWCIDIYSKSAVGESSQRELTLTIHPTVEGVIRSNSYCFILFSKELISCFEFFYLIVIIVVTAKMM